MTHLLTGSDDGYIRDYDIFSAVNGKVFLTAPQRQHCGVMEGLMKAAQLKCWWENPVDRRTMPTPAEDTPLCAPYSLLMHSDALWALSGSDVCILRDLIFLILKFLYSKVISTCSRYGTTQAALFMLWEDTVVLSLLWRWRMIKWDFSAPVGIAKHSYVFEAS